MSTAWTGVAMQRALEALEDDAKLSLYVDAFRLRLKLRDDEAPALTRHAIEIAPSDLTLRAAVTQANDELFTMTIRLWIVAWSLNDEDALLTANDTTGGIGGSTVGLLQMIEDVANALRSETLGVDSNGQPLLALTAMEVGGFAGMSVVRFTDLDRMFIAFDIPFTVERRGYHDAALRHS